MLQVIWNSRITTVEADDAARLSADRPRRPIYGVRHLLDVQGVNVTDRVRPLGSSDADASGQGTDHMARASILAWAENR